MQALLAGLVPGLPADVTARILERAEGVPLYAVETVRMLLDRGLLTPDDGHYRPPKPIAVPETLQALVAARLDGLAPAERDLVQDASVLGKTFTIEALSALTGAPRERIEPVLTGLVRKEVLSVVTDPRSPERGQFGHQLLGAGGAHPASAGQQKMTHPVPGHQVLGDIPAQSPGGPGDQHRPLGIEGTRLFLRPPRPGQPGREG